MDYEKLSVAIKLCGSTPKVDQCPQCPYWASGDMNNCIPRVTADAATAITDLLVKNQSLRNAANGFKARAEAAEARCKTLEKMVREYRDEIVPRYMEMAENAERERDEAREVICARCRVLPCRGNECYWYRGQKEE